MRAVAGDGIPTFVGMTRPDYRKEMSVGVSVKEACDYHPGDGLHFIATNPFSVIPAKAGTSSLTTEPYSVIPAKAGTF